MRREKREEGFEIVTSDRTISIPHTLIIKHRFIENVKGALEAAKRLGCEETWGEGERSLIRELEKKVEDGGEEKVA